MEQNNYLKLIWIVAFLICGWATAESLHLLLPSWPAVFCWAVTIVFFIIASLGTKMIVDSLNQNIYLEHRGLNLAGGIVIVIIFWLLFSMPTNTHTFFYWKTVNGMVTQDISATRGYLAQIQNNTNNEEQAKLKIEELKNKIDIKLIELEDEIKNDANPGFGKKAKEIFNQLRNELGVASIEPLSYRGTSKQEREKLCELYRIKIYAMAETKAKNIMASISKPNPTMLEEVKKVDENLALVEKYINEKKIDLNDPKSMKDDVCDKLIKGYSTVKKYRNFVNFSPETDEAKYTNENPATKVERILSVYDTWMDFFKQKYAGHGFGLWIALSVLVDIAAFIFFDLAFKKREV